MALSPTQQADVARQLARILFGGQVASLAPQPIITAAINHADILAAVQAIDAGFDTALSAAVTATSGTTTVVQYLASTIPAPASGGTAQQKTILACLVLLKRAGLV